MQVEAICIKQAKASKYKIKENMSKSGTKKKELKSLYLFHPVGQKENLHTCCLLQGRRNGKICSVHEVLTLKFRYEI